MAAGELSVWNALDGAWHYLGRDLPGVLDVAVLSVGRRLMAPVFTAPATAEPMLRDAPEGLALQQIGSDDLRAKEEWLRAAALQGAQTVVFDPALRHPDSEGRGDLGDGHPLFGLEIATELALAYVTSHKRASACL